MKHMRSQILLSATLLLAAATTGSAAAQHKHRPHGIPPGHLPPPGECRVWYDGTPPGQQPPPTDCRTASREAAHTGGRVIYGGDPGRGEGRHRDDYDRDRWDYPDVECKDREGRRGDCDWRDERCEDRDRDGWCDDTLSRYPASLPDMSWGALYRRGDRVPDGFDRWLDLDGAGVRLRDIDGDGVPDDVIWLDLRDAIVQRWLDDDRDGRADRVVIYRDGEVIRIVRR